MTVRAAGTPPEEAAMASRRSSRTPLPRDPHDGLRLENDVVGVRVWGPATQPTLSLGKADIWDRRWRGERQPLVTLEQIRGLAMKDELWRIAPAGNSTVYDVYNQYDFPCPKPGAQLILGTPFGLHATAQALAEDRVRLTVEGEDKSLRATIWVALGRALAVVEVEAEGLEPGDFWVRVYRHRDTILPGAPLDASLPGETAPLDFEPLPRPTCWRNAAHWGIVQTFPTELTFPEGFSFVAAVTALGLDLDIGCREGEPGMGTPLWAEREGRLSHGVVKRYTPINEATGAAATARFAALPKSLTLVATIATTQDGADPAAVTSRTLDSARELGIEGLRQEQSDALRRARRSARARASLHRRVLVAAAAVVRPRLRRSGGHYGDVPLCSVASTKFCFQDSAPWHGDFHLNEIRAEPMLTLGQFEELWPYCEMLHALLPQAQDNARDAYGLAGAMYPLVHFPLRCRGIAHTNLTWEQDMGLNGLITKPLWLYYRYTGDTEFLRDLAWPVLRECARFVAAYLTEEPDGRLHIVPTVSPEHWGLTAHFERNRDCLSALTLTRYLLMAAAKTARIVGQADAETAAWRGAAARLAPLPTHTDEEGTLWVDVAGAPPIEYNIPVPLAAVFWGDEVGLDSPPEVLDLAQRTLDRIRVWEPHRFYLDGCVRPRLGIWRQGAAVGPENLLLSYQAIRLFPAVPPDAEIAIEHFAAQGGFRIAARRTRGGDTRDVRIQSVLGWKCRVANPWPGRAAVAVAGSGVEVARIDSAEAYLEFATRPGAEYRLRPA